MPEYALPHVYQGILASKAFFSDKQMQICNSCIYTKADRYIQYREVHMSYFQLYAIINQAQNVWDRTCWPKGGMLD